VALGISRLDASLRWRLPALVTGLIVAVLLVFLLAAFFLVRTSLLRAGHERAHGAADQLANLFAQSAQQRLADLRVAGADGTIKRFLQDQDEANRRAALDRLRKLATSGSQLVELWDTEGHRLLALAVPPQAEQLLPPSERPSSPGYGPFHATDSAVFSDLTAAVDPADPRVEGSPSLPSGYLVVRRLSSTAGAADILGRLVGVGAAVAIGNRAGAPWTDLSRIVTTPEVDLQRAASAEIRDRQGVQRIGALSFVAGTPWAVWVDFPRSQIVAPARGLLLQMSGVLVLVGLLSAVITVGLTRRVTTPLAALTAAAEAGAEGDYTHRVTIGRADEIGRLADAFNTMGVHVAEDIAARERVGRALRESEARKSAVMEGALDCIVTMDHHGLITEFNPAAERTFGYSRHDAIGQPLADLLIPPGLRGRHQQGLAHYIETGAGPVLGKRIELPAMRCDGTEFPAELAIVVVQQDGPPVFTGFVRDLTDQKAADEARLRTLRLEADNKRVQEASRLKSEFLANMSHELRTPLNAIIGFAELLHDGEVRPDMPQFKEFLHDILTSGQHLLQLINDILDLSKVEAGKLEFRPEPIDLHQVIREVISIVRTTAATKRIKVTHEVEEGIRDSVLDRGRLKQVLYNYVSNALKFTPEGGHVIIRARAQDGDRFRLEVEDTGIGIGDDDLGRLFVEFHQLAAGTAKKHAGTGLGLALTKRLVEAQGGAVGVRSRAGHGSVFWADLPRRAAVNAPALESRVFPAASPGAPTILVIEDDARDQESLVRTLVAAGYAVQTAMTGAQAIDQLQRQAFSAITLDLLLPDMSGMDVLKAIRHDNPNRGVPIIVITIVSETGAIAGMAVHDVFPKPCQPAELLVSLQRAGVVAGAGDTILVIDDDPSSLRLMAATLEREGYGSVCVPDGASGLHLAEQAPPAMVILDLLMPEMTGFEFLARFRKLPHCRLTPVLVWTVKDLSQEEYRLLKSSAQGVMVKGEEGAGSVVGELARFLRKGPAV